MKSTKFIAFMAFGLVLFTSCRETVKEKETVVREVEVEKETEEQKGVLERTAEKVDKEVNKEVNEEIEKIGDDN